MKPNALYAQSGGVTSVINASACGVIETARKHRDRIGKLYAGRNGILGALQEELIDTSAESAAAIAALRHTPGGAFGSARYKLKGLDENKAEYERLSMSSGRTTSAISSTTAAAIPWIRPTRSPK
jgi:6-phosphofructokinase 1